MHRTTWRGTGTQRCAFAMAWSMPRKSARSWTPRRSAGEVANVSCVRDQVRSPTASRRRREARRCSPLPRQQAHGVRWAYRRGLGQEPAGSAAPHLLGGKPDPQVPELDESAAVGPPHEAKLLDEEQTKPSMGLFRCAFRIGRGSHMASLVWRGQDWASAVPVRAALILGHTSPLRLTIWA